MSWVLNVVILRVTLKIVSLKNFYSGCYLIKKKVSTQPNVPQMFQSPKCLFFSCLSIVLEYFIYDPPNPIQVIKLLTGCLKHQQAWEGTASLLWTLASPVSGRRLHLWRVRGGAGALGEGDNLSIYCLKVPQKGRLAPTSPSTSFPFFLFVPLSRMSWVPKWILIHCTFQLLFSKHTFL